MIKLKINSFKSGLFWYACCEIPTEELSVYYFNNNPTETIASSVTLHSIGLTSNSVNRKIVNKLKQHFKERKRYCND